jgi:Zn-dependent protease with chaperone function
VDTLAASEPSVTLAGRGLCFGTGLAPQGERVDFDLASDRLRLWPDTPRERSVPYYAIRLEPGGFERTQFQLTWSDDGPWALVLDHDGLARRVRANPPAALREDMARLEANLRRGRLASGVGWTLVGTIVVAPVLLVALLWWQADRLVGAAVARIPVSWEEQLGETAFEQLTQGRAMVTEGAAVRAVHNIGDRLTAQVDSPYTFRWHVVDDPQVNAFAVPGGHVVVFTGLLRAADSPEEVAGVLAHEVQHVVLRHSLHGLVRSLGWSATIRILFGGTGPLAGVGDLAAQLGRLSFSREQETAADLEGLKVLQRARIDPQGMVTFFEKLSQKESGIALLSTHPMSSDRADRLRSEITRAGSWPTDPLSVAWTEVVSSADRGGR